MEKTDAANLYTISESMIVTLSTGEVFRFSADDLAAFRNNGGIVDYTEVCPDYSAITREVSS